MEAHETISIENQIKTLAKKEGVALVGVCSAAGIKDKEISDPSYLLPEARSVISIAVNYGDENIKKYLAKKERDPFCLEENLKYKKLKEIGEKIKTFLEKQGCKAVNCDVNLDYRGNKINREVIEMVRQFIDLVNKSKDEKDQLTKAEEETLAQLRQKVHEMMQLIPTRRVPELSHRCVAVAAGLGRIGWSGNLVTEEYGARVVLNSIITDAELIPDKPLAKNPCKQCKLCERSCQAGYFSRDEKQTITIAGIEETIATRGIDDCCSAVCSGLTGQNRFKEWSTWSPYRSVSLPNDDTLQDFVRNLKVQALENGGKQAEHFFQFIRNIYIGLHNRPLEDKALTCTYCQLVCGPSMTEKKESHRMITNSGCIVDESML